MGSHELIGRIKVLVKDYIAKHLHGFALRCLPWRTGGNKRGLIKSKPADASNLSELTDEDNENGEPAYLDVTEADTPTQLYETLKATIFSLLGKPHPKYPPTWPYDEQEWEQILSVEERFPKHLSVAELLVKHQARWLTSNGDILSHSQTCSF